VNPILGNSGERCKNGDSRLFQLSLFHLKGRAAMSGDWILWMAQNPNFLFHYRIVFYGQALEMVQNGWNKRNSLEMIQNGVLNSYHVVKKSAR